MNTHRILRGLLAFFVGGPLVGLTLGLIVNQALALFEWESNWHIWVPILASGALQLWAIREVILGLAHATARGGTAVNPDWTALIVGGVVLLVVALIAVAYLLATNEGEQ